ncbi:MAG TPA: PIN domain-containing protein [Pirellulales bacterium]|nr:PIN domain-containing protein [Pirellulales bacterium]
MTPLFADTSFFVAFLSAEDRHHATAVEYMETCADPIVTTQWILAELGNFLSKGPARRMFAPFIRTLRSEHLLSIEEAGGDSFQRAVEFYGRRVDKEWSFVDCTSFQYMKRERISLALTADHHFEQAGFTILLK